MRNPTHAMWAAYVKYPGGDGGGGSDGGDGGDGGGAKFYRADGGTPVAPGSEDPDNGLLFVGHVPAGGAFVPADDGNGRPDILVEFFESLKAKAGEGGHVYVDDGATPGGGIFPWLAIFGVEVEDGEDIWAARFHEAGEGRADDPVTGDVAPDGVHVHWPGPVGQRLGPMFEAGQVWAPVSRSKRSVVFASEANSGAAGASSGHGGTDTSFSPWDHKH